MEKLVPFGAASFPFTLEGSISFASGRLTVHFTLIDPSRAIVGGVGNGVYPGQDVARADGLWKETCFEAFFGETGSAAYWELNLAPNGRVWNLYRFDNYRTPQPPARSTDFELEKIEVRNGRLECVLVARAHVGTLEASLCAVLMTASGPQYLATAHTGPKPDFHLRESFRLRP